VYYSCCCVDKILRIESAKGSKLAKDMHLIFLKRWTRSASRSTRLIVFFRWHKPVHTAAYALDPSYHSHQLSDVEHEEFEDVLKKLYPSEWNTIISQWRDYKAQIGEFSVDTRGLESIWGSVDTKPAWKWWDDVPCRGSTSKLRKAAIQLTARVSAASCCEFNWSDMDDIMGKKRTQLNTATLEKLVRHRAVSRLKTAIRTSKMTMVRPLCDRSDRHCM
jgi:hypothetical protein